MILSNCLPISCLVGLLGLTAVAAEKLDLKGAVGSLVEAERAYAKLGAEKGFRAASLANFSDDAVIFAPDLISGKKFWTEAKEDPVINWGPGFASIARSGDLGYTTGPAVYFENRNDPKPVGYGHFVSIWQRNSEGIWKVMVDVGVNHTQPSEPLGEAKTWIPKSASVGPKPVRFDSETESAFMRALMQDEGAAILTYAAEEIRIYRRGAVPIVGKAVAQPMLGAEHGKTTRNRRGGGMSKANDLAYSYGDYSSDHDGVTDRGIYFCIWQVDSGNNWKLVADLQKKAPPAKS